MGRGRKMGKWRVEKVLMNYFFVFFFFFFNVI
jgi:hypothetical protein